MEENTTMEEIITSLNLLRLSGEESDEESERTAGEYLSTGEDSVFREMGGFGGETDSGSETEGIDLEEALLRSSVSKDSELSVQSYDMKSFIDDDSKEEEVNSNEEEVTTSDDESPDSDSELDSELLLSDSTELILESEQISAPSWKQLLSKLDYRGAQSNHQSSPSVLTDVDSNSRKNSAYVKADQCIIRAHPDFRPCVVRVPKRHCKVLEGFALESMKMTAEIDAVLGRAGKQKEEEPIKSSMPDNTEYGRRKRRTFHDHYRDDLDPDYELAQKISKQKR